MIYYLFTPRCHCLNIMILCNEKEEGKERTEKETR